eukprot:TRINITY_DN54791_c0_g1_i1.p1 TRINITY_DN54791_c0_g1~~TRINITY_DN54791_c0_g1_i1.p1  ORF type:complete len:260 (+),score=58.41 TRINITY_DN54791_c0_g1_i1:70-849(+)
MDPENPHTAVLQPRRPGESLKVAETVLRRREHNLKEKAARAAAVQRIRRDQKEFKKGKLKIVRAEKLILQSRKKRGDVERLKRQTLKKKPKTGQVHGKVIAVVRNSRMGGSRMVKRTLNELGLQEHNTVTFQPNTDITIAKLHIVRPFAFWGPPSFKVVSTIMQKKAIFRDPEDPTIKKLLCDNTLVEEHLGDLGLLCTEDLAHAIHRCDPCFEKVTERLWPVPVGEAKKSSGMVYETKIPYGNMGHDINKRLTKLIGE